jgi:ABC-type glycerol-3-phosphate transport system substrate-binding protein
MGLFVDLNELKPQLDNTWYDDYILPITQEHLKIDGVLYGVPNWARRQATGGNVAWMYTTEIHEAAGSPEITTFYDLFDYAVYVRDNVTETSDGLPVIPVMALDDDGFGLPIVRGIYRSFGAPFEDGFYGRVGDRYMALIYDPVYQDALIEANRWFREGLFDPTMFTDTRDQFFEKVTSGRGGLMWFDHSLDDGNNFRKIMREALPVILLK